MGKGLKSLVVGFATGGTLLASVQASLGKTPDQTSQQQANRNKILERLTLLLVDRLPTQWERDIWLSKGKHSTTQLADLLVASPEFFHRQASYWQTQFNESPAWKWESRLNPYQINLKSVEPEKKRHLIWYTAPSQSSSLARSCTGVWTVANTNNVPQPCSCDEAVDLLPFWDKASPMRVCPTALEANRCGQSLEQCFPVDKRLSPDTADLEIDKDSAAGLAIDRLLIDLSLANGRALALNVINKQKWSKLSSIPFRTVMSRSSIALMSQWSRVLQDTFSLELTQSLRFSENPEQLEQSFGKPSFLPRAVQGFKALALPSAESYLISSPLSNFLTVRPLRYSRLNDSVWHWNSNLIFSCSSPFVAQQQFQLPLQHPDKAKTASYFCSGCHMKLDVHSTIQTGLTEKSGSTITTQNDAECAVTHALQFLLGSSPTDNLPRQFKELGQKSFKTNSESLAAVIRDLAIDLAGYSNP
ncbi:MAG: hypothetical protein RJB13_1146 [Pseudomonadota bacterium]